LIISVHMDISIVIIFSNYCLGRA